MSVGAEWQEEGGMGGEWGSEDGHHLRRKGM
jgi:hypothetical protein